LMYAQATASIRDFNMIVAPCYGLAHQCGLANESLPSLCVRPTNFCPVSLHSAS
jgi:hypothetical protein